MNKNRVLFLLGVLAVSYIAMYAFLVHEYIVVLFLVVFFGYQLKRERYEVDQKVNIENEELLNEVKITTRDAYLKHKQLLTMVTSIPSPLVLLNAYGDVVLYNSNFNVLRKSSADERLDYINNDCVKQVGLFMKDAYILEKELKKVITVKNKTFNAISIPVTTNKKFSGCVLLFQDISDEKKRESLQKQFVADASHELKTPISVIKGMVEILNRDDFDDAETSVEFLKQINKETKRLEFIVKDLLQLSRLSMSGLIINCKEVELSPVIEGCISSFQMLAKKKSIKIVTMLNCKECVFVDEELMTTLLNNLISNGIKYSDAGTITIKTKKIVNEYIIEVQDEGVGLTQEDCSQVFERFYRVDKARSRNSGGSGLGLSIVKSICDAHGATVEIDSELGKGTTVKMKFQKHN